MDVLTPETRWALNNEIKKQITSSWSLFIQIFIYIKRLTYSNEVKPRDEKLCINLWQFYFIIYYLEKKLFNFLILTILYNLQ